MTGSVRGGADDRKASGVPSTGSCDAGREPSDTNTPATYWHGGGRIVGDMVLPPTATGITRSDDDDPGLVHVTTDRNLAATYASTINGAAWLYEVDPIGVLEPRASLVNPHAEPIAFACPCARIVRRYTISNAERRRRAAVVMIADDLAVANDDRDNRSSARRPDFFSVAEQYPTTSRLFAPDRPGSGPDRRDTGRSRPGRPDTPGNAEIETWGAS